MFNRRLGLVAALASLGAEFATGADKMTQAAVSQANFAQAFSRRFGNNPRSLNGNSHRNSKAAQQKRAAVKRRNIAKHPRSTLGRKRRA